MVYKFDFYLLKTIPKMLEKKMMIKRNRKKMENGGKPGSKNKILMSMKTAGTKKNKGKGKVNDSSNMQERKNTSHER